MLNKSGSLTLADSTRGAIPVHISMALKVASWATEAIDTLIRGLFWCGMEVDSGGKCVVALINAYCPKDLGGLRIANLQLMGI
jgi:hypothetical protein